MEARDLFHSYTPLMDATGILITMIVKAPKGETESGLCFSISKLSMRERGVY